MFVRYYVEIPHPPEAVEAALFDAPTGWLSMLAGEASQRGDGLLAEVGVGPLGPRLGRRVMVSVGAPVRFPSKTLLPFTWRPTSGNGLLPDLDGDIELGSLGPGRTQLALSGRQPAAATILAIRRATGESIAYPGPEVDLAAGDHVAVLGSLPTGSHARARWVCEPDSAKKGRAPR